MSLLQPAAHNWLRTNRDEIASNWSRPGGENLQALSRGGHRPEAMCRHWWTGTGESKAIKFRITMMRGRQLTLSIQMTPTKKRGHLQGKATDEDKPSCRALRWTTTNFSMKPANSTTPLSSWASSRHQKTALSRPILTIIQCG